jgi:hypothetical protein
MYTCMLLRRMTDGHDSGPLLNYGGIDSTTPLDDPSHVFVVVTVVCR